jgi:hypothetical protein
MFCAKCQKGIIDCTCPDIEERLGNLYQNPYTRAAAAMNILVREMRQAEVRVGELEAKNKQLQEAAGEKEAERNKYLRQVGELLLILEDTERERDEAREEVERLRKTGPGRRR